MQRQPTLDHNHATSGHQMLKVDSNIVSAGKDEHRSNRTFLERSAIEIQSWGNVLAISLLQKKQR